MDVTFFLTFLATAVLPILLEDVTRNVIAENVGIDGKYVKG